ncbi:MAG: 50S ribosomal protein L25 [Elusimicrobia bacterium]|nr:50S ribosomal protein L25 [Elusimicrobiota bacterium]MBD3412748.1 50S ribosomal protein L25 [Elusimicrobiota bacterium]
MGDITLVAEKRSIKTQAHLNDIRRSKMIPSVVYGGTKKNIPISVSAKDFHNAIHGDAGLNVIISLELDNQTDKVIVHEVQRDVITKEIIHVDFHRITMTKKIKVKVPVHLTGEAVGQEMGGVVDHTLREIEVECLPGDIPPHFDVDITNLNIGQAILVKEIPKDPKVVLLADPEQIVVHVVTADKEEPKPEPAAAETLEAAAEPEVIAKGKEKEEADKGTEPAEKKKQPEPDKEKK